MTQAMKVYEAIAAVSEEISKKGIAKNNSNQQQGYKFRGIDDVYNSLAPLLAKHKLCVLPRMIGREREERVSVKEWNGNKKETVLFYVTVDAEFDFISAEDGSKHVIKTYGEAMDSGDKATNKAMSAAYKYACMQAFCIPTEADNDADASTHEDIQPKVQQSGAKSPSKDEAARNLYKRLENVIRAKKSLEALNEWGKDTANQDDISKLPTDWQQNIRNEFKAKRDELRKPAQDDDDGFPGSNETNYSGVAAE